MKKRKNEWKQLDDALLKLSEKKKRGNKWNMFIIYNKVFWGCIFTGKYAKIEITWWYIPVFCIWYIPILYVKGLKKIVLNK